MMEAIEMDIKPATDPARHFDTYATEKARALKRGPTCQTRLRAKKAIQLLLEGDTERLSCSREYDNCFENYDGDFVVFLIMTAAHNDPAVDQALKTWPAARFVDYEGWEKHYQSMLARMESGTLFE